MDLLAYSFATSTAALQVSKRRTGVGCTEFCVVVQFVRPLKGGADWTDIGDLDLDLDVRQGWTG